MIASIDPGLRGCGVAMWSDDGILMRAAYVVGAVRQKGMPLPTYANAWREMADAVGRYWGSEPDLLVIECMQTYEGRASRGDANDLLQVNAVVGALSMLASKVRAYVPSEWKGAVPKGVIEERAKQKLSDVERRRIELPAKSLCSNVWDGVGIGLFYLGVTGKRSETGPISTPVVPSCGQPRG